MARRKGFTWPKGSLAAGSKGLRHIGPGGKRLPGTGYNKRGGGRKRGTVGGQRRDSHGRFA